MNAKVAGKTQIEIKKENMDGDRRGGTSKWVLAQKNDNFIR